MFSLDPEIVAHALGDARFATWEWDPSSDELRWTSGQIEIYARPSSEINSTQAWESIVHPEDRERVRRAAEHALATETARHLFDGKALLRPGQPTRLGKLDRFTRAQE